MSFASSGPSPTTGSGYAPVTYQRLMRLAARAFYTGPCPPPGRDNDTSFSARSKIAKMDTRGLGIVLLDYLTTVEWTSFELLSEALRLHPVVLSRAMRFLEAGHMIRRYERRESRRKKRNLVGDALEADVAQGDESEDDEEEEGGVKKKGLLTEYFTLDYARAFDALQIRIHTMRFSLKEQLESSNAVQAYRCPGPFCGKTYTSLDAANLVDPMELTFKCEICGSELVEQRATNDVDGAGGTQHATARESKEAARRLLQAIDRELAPITRLMADLQHRAVPLPDPGELYEWAQRVRQREADMAAAVGGGAAGGGGGSGRGSGGMAGGGNHTTAGSSGAPAALLAGSGVTVLSAADNTNTWESQDFKVSLNGGTAASGEGRGLLFGSAMPAVELTAPVDSGRKALPWFMKAANGKTGSDSAGGDEDASAAAAASEGGDRGKQQQQAEYFRDFMKYMSKLQQEKRPSGTTTPQKVSRAVAPYGAVKPELRATPSLGPAAEAVPAVPSTALAAPKTELGVYGATVASATTAKMEVEWEDVGGLMLPPLSQQHPKLEEDMKTGPAVGFGGDSGGGMALDEDGDVEWEDV